MAERSHELLVLESALEEYFDAAVAQKSENPPDLKPVFERLNHAIAGALPVAQPRLKHFLESASYRKAHTFLKTLE